jgi:hypothetical protein
MGIVQYFRHSKFLLLWMLYCVQRRGSKARSNHESELNTMDMVNPVQSKTDLLILVCFSVNAFVYPPVCPMSSAPLDSVVQQMRSLGLAHAGSHRNAICFGRGSAVGVTLIKCSAVVQVDKSLTTSPKTTLLFRNEAPFSSAGNGMAFGRSYGKGSIYMARWCTQPKAYYRC